MKDIKIGNINYHEIEQKEFLDKLDKEFEKLYKDGIKLSKEYKEKLGVDFSNEGFMLGVGCAYRSIITEYNKSEEPLSEYDDLINKTLDFSLRYHCILDAYDRAISEDMKFFVDDNDKLLALHETEIETIQMAKGLLDSLNEEYVKEEHFDAENTMYC